MGTVTSSAPDLAQFCVPNSPIGKEGEQQQQHFQNWGELHCFSTHGKQVSKAQRGDEQGILIHTQLYFVSLVAVCRALSYLSFQALLSKSLLSSFRTEVGEMLKKCEN